MGCGASSPSAPAKGAVNFAPADCAPGMTPIADSPASASSGVDSRRLSANVTTLLAAGKLHVQLQRARRRVFLTAVSAPDDVESFTGAVAAGHASPAPLRRQASSLTTPSPSLRRSSALASQKAASSASITEEGDEGAAGADGSVATGDAHPAPKAPAMMRSGEMSSATPAELEQRELDLPLPPSLVGTFSCHGIDENADKINQDCACVAYPLTGDDLAALFIVLDGHGER